MGPVLFGSLEKPLIAIFSAGSGDDNNAKLLTEAAKDRGYNIVTVKAQDCLMDLGKNTPTTLLHKGKDILEQGIDAFITRVGSYRLSYKSFRGSSLVKGLENLQKEGKCVVVNASDPIKNSGDKLLTHLLLVEHGIKTPVTIMLGHSSQIEDAFLRLPKSSTGEVVVKYPEGSLGNTVWIEPEEQAKKLVREQLKKNQSVFIQEFIEQSRGTDIRCFVVGDEVVAAMRRQSRDPIGNPKSNLSQGGYATPVKVTPKIKELAIASARAVGLEIAGVDLVKRDTPDGPEYLVLEVNSSPGIKGIQDVTKVDVAGAIIDYTIAKFKQKAQGKMDIAG
jgi:ribosomal protein S6--L-glutamate ligase